RAGCRRRQPAGEPPRPPAPRRARVQYPEDDSDPAAVSGAGPGEGLEALPGDGVRPLPEVPEHVRRSGAGVRALSVLRRDGADREGLAAGPGAVRAPIRAPSGPLTARPAGPALRSVPRPTGRGGADGYEIARRRART